MSTAHGRWMMIACCVPMLVIAIVLVGATGVAGAGFIAVAVAGTAILAALMFAMFLGGGGR